MPDQMSRRLSRAGLALLALAMLALASPIAAQSYPSHMIRIIGATAAGTPPDIMGRIIANELAESEGWRVVVENKPSEFGQFLNSQVTHWNKVIKESGIKMHQ